MRTWYCFSKPAPGVDFGHPRDAAHLGLDDPVVQRAQLGQVAARARQRVVKHFAQAGRHRPHRRPFDARGHFDRGRTAR